MVVRRRCSSCSWAHCGYVFCQLRFLGFVGRTECLGAWTYVLQEIRTLQTLRLLRDLSNFGSRAQQLSDFEFGGFAPVLLAIDTRCFPVGIALDKFILNKLLLFCSIL